MPNPLLSDSTFNRAAQAPGWAAPDPATRSTTIGGSGSIGTGPSPLDAAPGTYYPPITDGPTSTWDSRVMTVAGTAKVTGVLLAILLAAAAVGWQSGPDSNATNPGFPALAIVGVIVGLVAVVVASFKPHLAKFLAPVYAVAQGFFVGVISKAYNTAYDGIVLQAIGATVGVFAVMLVLYQTRILKVTSRMRRIVIGATAGLMVFYLVSFIINLFGGNVSFLSSSSGLGIAFSVLAAGLAAFNLALDFDFIERGAARQMPKGMEWFAALGLLVTLVWLYLEMLRLLAKLQDRR